ncbi:MAG TPA: acetyl-CoA carboxylase biotin carboxylase subunit [Dehalococcoidia bacterium]|nr:acetyl-CoA carboxylase biotin carboxylase subunit [Dehalococcoidia bacterium]
MLKKVLVANRGEIAVRVMRACRDLGVRSVAVYSEPDATAMHARYADEAYLIGPGPASESYLNAAKIIETALACGADAIHPGYGFLSERADFAEACADAGIVFIGPSPSALRALGDKVEARRIAEAAGAPTVPGSGGRVSLSEALKIAPSVGYPLLIKAASGGGGKGIRLVEKPEDLETSLRTAAAEALASFGDDGLYIEKYLDPVRHIEVQVLADTHGNIVHLGERECSVQRRSQKLVEESPSTVVNEATRARIGAAAVAIAREAGYANAGTIEFLMDKDGAFYFIEANARLQVEHPVTELVTGYDLVREQLRIASGERLSFAQDDVRLRGWAIECRIIAEDADFLPSLGRIELVTEPSGLGVRVDSAMFNGAEVGPYYDSLLAKLIVWGENRGEALARLRRALGEYQVLGVKTTLPFHRQLADDPAFIAGEIDTRYIDRREKAPEPSRSDDDTALAVAALLKHERRPPESERPLSGAWRRAAREAAVNRSRGGRWRDTS